MYVAMTRAKEKVFLVSQSVQPSSFIVEIEKISKSLGIKFNNVVLRGDVVGPCPECLSKGLVEGRWRGALVRRVRNKHSSVFHIFGMYQLRERTLQLHQQ